MPNPIDVIEYCSPNGAEKFRERVIKRSSERFFTVAITVKDK